MMADSQIAVLIDFENVGLSSVQRLFDQISDVGRVIVKRAYGDWSEARSHRDRILELAIEPIHLFHSVRSGKNSSDLRLAIDAVDLLYQAAVDTFVIVSTDSDFVPLVSRLRAAGKTVIGAGPKATAPRTLVIACDRFLYLDGRESTAQAGQAPPPQSKANDDSLLTRAVMAAMDEDGQVVGSKLHETLQRLDPAFDYRIHGYSTFTRFLEASPEVNARRPRGPGDVIVELADASVVTSGTPLDPQAWGPKIDAAWKTRANQPGGFIAGSTAGKAAAAILGAVRLGDTEYKSLQRLIDHSEALSRNWVRDGNRVVRRQERDPGRG